MEIKQMAERLNSVPVRKKAKRLLAAALAVLMVNPITGYGVAAHAQEARTIMAFAELSGKIASQQLAVGAEESDIHLPDTLNVTIGVSGADTAESIVKDSQADETTAEESQPDKSTVEKPQAAETSGEDSTVSENDTAEPQDEANGADTATATDSNATPVKDSGEAPSAETTTGAAISADADQTRTEKSDTEKITLEEQTLTGITWKINAERSGSDTFDSANAGAVFFYEPVLPEGYTLAEGVSLPQIQVQIEDSGKWAFSQSTTIDGVEITVKAEKDVFPEGAVLHAEKVTSADDKEKIQSAVSKEVKAEDTAKTVAELVSFDITITDADGNELQPDTSKGEVRVSFAQLPMVTEDTAPTQEMKVFHMDDSLNEAKGLDTTVDQKAGTLEAPAEHFTVYTAALLTAGAEDGEASVTDSEGAITYYDTVEEAITDAQGMSGSTVKLLKDVATESQLKISSGTFTIDLNGKTWVGADDNIALTFNGSTSVTLKDSIGGGEVTSTYAYVLGATAHTVSLAGGKYKGIGNVSSKGTIGDLLAVGYAYKNSDGTWVSDLSNWKISNVTVMPEPVKIAAQPENVVAYTESPALSVTAVTVPADSGKDITYQWYSVGTGSGGVNEAISGATEASYAFPIDSSAAGTYTYYCAITCDGYSVNTRNATVEYTPVKITAQPEDAVATPSYTEAEAPTFTVTAQTVPADSGKDITYQWYHEGGTAVDGATATSASYTVSTGLPEGTYTYYCAVTCDGYTVNSQNATFYVTSSTGNYSVTSSSGATVSYPTLETAILAAKSKPNSTVKLLAAATTADTVEVSSGTFTIDLNGYTWTSTTSYIALKLTNSSHVTLKDSATGGKFTTSTASKAILWANDASVTIESGIYENMNDEDGAFVIGAFTSGTVAIHGGTFLTGNGNYRLAYFQGVNLSIDDGTFSGSIDDISPTISYAVIVDDCQSVSLSGGTYRRIETTNGVSLNTLLASGYGFKNVSGGWVDSGDVSLPNVTVQPAPVKITAEPQGVSATYGYTSAEAPSLNVTAENTATATGSISYQWYRVKSGTETSDTAVGTNSSTLTIPIDLDAGTHSFYCVVSCDGYILNSQSATFTVEKATPTITLDVFTREDEPYIYNYGSGVFLQAFVTGINGEKPDGTVTFKNGNDVITTSSYDSFSESYSAGGSQYPNAGTHSFTVIYTPSTDGTGKNYVGVTSAAVERTIAKADQDDFSIEEVIGKKYGDGSFLLETSGGGSTGGVTYSVPDNNKVLSVSGNTATIIGAGTVTVSATKAGDNNYNSATTTYEITISKADTTIAFNESYASTYTFTGTALPVPSVSDLTITGATYTDVTFTWYKNSVADENRLSAAPSAPGTYVVVSSIADTANASAASAEKTVTISFYSGVATVLYNGSPALAAWYTTDVTIIAAGYSISDSADGTYTSSYLLNGEGTVSKTLYFKQDGTGYITDGQTVSVNIDKTLPAFSDQTDGITISDNNWKGFLNQITFGHFFKENKDVSISATDSGSGVSKYYYYIDTGSTTAKTAEELNGLSFTEGGSFSITGENKYIIYAYAVDHAGNKSAYICTDGIVIDKTAPTVTLTKPEGYTLEDTSALAYVRMNETGTIAYVVKTFEQTGITAETILSADDKATVSVAEDRENIDLYAPLSDLTANTTYYFYAVGTDSAGNNSEVKSMSFTTTKTQPIFSSNPTVTGTYGQQIKDMTVSQLASTNGISGSWSVSGTAVPSVGSTYAYSVVFTPDNTAQYAVVTRNIIPTVQPKNLTAEGVAIGEVSGTYTYDGTGKTPTVTVTDSAAAITASDYEYSYSNNINAGTATVTVTAKGNYTGTVSRTFTIAKASVSSIIFPTAGGLTYGQKLSASILTGGSTEYGTFAWTNGDTVPTVVNSGYDVTFTPSTDAAANYEVSATTEAVSVSVSKAAPAVSVSVSLSGNVGSRQATLTATVTGSGDGDIPAGTIQFVNTTGGSTVNIGSAVTLVNGAASFDWTGLADQSYTVKAVYSGNGNYNTADSSELEVDTRKQNQAAIAIDSISLKTYGDSSFTLSATGGSGTGAVTFESSDPSIVSIFGSTATIHKAGTVSITATKAEDETYNQATATVSLTVGKKTLSIGTGDELTLSSSSYTYDGSAKEPGVTVKLGGKTLIEGTDYTVTYSDNTNVGTAGVTITGMGNYEGTINTTFSISKANQNTLSVTEVTGKKYLDSAFTLTSAGGSGAGGVTYSVPEYNGVLSISGSTATIIGAGTVTVTATKAADNNYNSTTATREITIGKAAAPTITFPTADGVTYGQKLSASTLTGGSSQYGIFAWTNGNTVPTVANSGYEVTFTPSTATLKNYETITGITDTVAITVSNATPAVTVNAAISDDTGSRKATLTATVAGAGDGETPTGTVKFVNSTSGSDVDITGATAVTITGGKAIYTWTGLAKQIYKVKAVYNGSANYNNATSTELSFDTNKQNQAALNIGSIGTKTYGDGAFTLSATGGSVSGAASFTSSDPTIVSISGTTATIHKAGTVTITATKAANNTYNEVTASVSLTVGKKALTIKADDKLNIIKGAAMPELTYIATGLVGSDTFTSPTISTTAADTNTVGEYDITISGGTLANADSYAVTYTNGKLTVVNATYTVTVTNGTGSGSYSEGQTVTITADSRSGYTFTGWSSSDGVTFANSTASTTTFTMPGKAVTITANYSKNSSGDNGGSSGGGSSSGGSGAPTTTTPEKMPNQPVTAAAPVTATAGKNGAASASIPDKAVTDAIAKAQSDATSQGKTANGISVELNVTMPKGTASLTAALTRSSLDSLVSAGVSSLEINGSPVSVSFDKKALAEIQKQSTGNISIAIAPKTNLSDAAKKIIGTRPVYDIIVGYGSGKTVSSFGGGIATVSIPYTLGKNEAVGGLYAVYVDAKGNATRIAGSAYDANSGCVIFTTTHFSQYGIGYTAPAAKFADISSHWAKESIDYVVGRGLLSGTSDTAFSPNSAMTRGMLVTALGRLAGMDTKAYTGSSFTDVKADSAYRPYIEWAYSKGIIQGIGNNQFASDREVTREEIAVIFANYAKATGYTLPITREATTYADAVNIGSFYKDAVKAMQQAGIMMGGSDNKFNPKGNATRAEVSSMLSRYIKLTINPATAQGWAQNDAGQYLYYKDGKALTDTQTIDGVKYFFGSDGTLKTGWVKDGDNWRFYSGKTMLVGWWDLGANGNNKTYYFTKDGLMVSGKWLEIDGKWYYFYADGSLARSAKIDGYEVDKNGVRKTK